MKLSVINIRNFRRLENVSIDMEEQETIFVGPNNSGKTSATAIFRCFLGGRDFKIYDFSATCASSFDTFLESADPSVLPQIELDLWFTIDPDAIEFGRVFTLLPDLSDHREVGLRLSYGVLDAEKLLEQYSQVTPAAENGARSKTLYQFLASDNNFSRNFVTRYSLLEKSEDNPGNIEVKATEFDPDEGKRLIKNLVRVEFVDAQRNIHDDDRSRSTRLSAAFATFYKKNLEQKDLAAQAQEVIDANNEGLTNHYEEQFAPLFDLIAHLGVPSVNDRDLRIVSSLSPETALQGNTELLYIDQDRKHELPELYNGLGFKNLIYIAIQIQHFYSQWLMTAVNRPLCLLLFIEEPEVHLHAQVQQAFIANIKSVIDRTLRNDPSSDLSPQIVITTHSTHILDAAEFEKIRYFQRTHSENSARRQGILEASMVKSLRSFQPEVSKPTTPTDAIMFLKRYLRLTHCDLFFADAVILVEGAAEKLLMPIMIDKSAPSLRKAFLSILEVGGAYAHRFEGLLAYLKIPYLVITDLDSVDPNDGRKTCRPDMEGAKTSNGTLKDFFKVSTIDELLALPYAERLDPKKDRFVAFQSTVDTEGVKMIPRTFEEAIAYENIDFLRSEDIDIGVEVPEELTTDNDAIYNRVKSDAFKKIEFAMNLLATRAEWKTPRYVQDGLRWLESRLFESGSALSADASATKTRA